MNIQNPAQSADLSPADERVQPDSPLSGEVKRGGNPWPKIGDHRRATDAARGDNARIAALDAQVRQFQIAYPHSSWPTVPPVVAPIDRNGCVIDLDCEVLVNRDGRMGMSPWRGRVVGIGDGGLPGRVILRVRPHGSNYVSAARAESCEVHSFDDYAWVCAEEQAARMMARRNIDLAECLWGYFHFDEFKREATRWYVAGLRDAQPLPSQNS